MSCNTILPVGDSCQHPGGGKGGECKVFIICDFFTSICLRFLESFESWEGLLDGLVRPAVS